jgi:hypothetical protein
MIEKAAPCDLLAFQVPAASTLGCVIYPPVADFRSGGPGEASPRLCETIAFSLTNAKKGVHVAYSR